MKLTKTMHGVVAAFAEGAVAAAAMQIAASASETAALAVAANPTDWMNFLRDRARPTKMILLTQQKPDRSRKRYENGELGLDSASNCPTRSDGRRV